MTDNTTYAWYPYVTISMDMESGKPSWEMEWRLGDRQVSRPYLEVEESDPQRAEEMVRSWLEEIMVQAELSLCYAIRYSKYEKPTDYEFVQLRLIREPERVICMKRQPSVPTTIMSGP